MPPIPSHSLPEMSHSPNAAPQEQNEPLHVQQNTPLEPAYDAQPEATIASATNGGREVSKNILYVGGLDKTITEASLQEMMSNSGHVTSVKILNDKNKPGFNYAFVEFESASDAEQALHAYNGQSVNDSPLKINYAYQSSTFTTSQNVDQPVYNIFVGDLSPEVDDEALYKFFACFQSLKQAHVMWDMQTSRSRGYGFATFSDAGDAETALQTMNGKQLLGRAVRCNWASHKQQNARGNNPGRVNNQRQFRQHFPRGAFNNAPPPIIRNDSAQFAMDNNHYHMPQAQDQHLNMMGQGGAVMTPQSYDIVLRQSPSWQTTVYLGNIAHFTQQNDLIPLLQNFGYIVDFKFHPEKGCAFVKYDSHERAALVIVQLAGFNVNGRPLKCGWGKSRPPVPNQYHSFQRPGQQIFSKRQ